MDLVFDVPDPYIESMKADGSSVILVRRDSARLSTEELARALRYEGLLSARALDEKRIEARFTDAKTAALCAEYANFGFDVGPFAIESQAPERIRLVRRSEGSLDIIEIVKSTKSDEWRRLLAHDIDVVPKAAGVHRSQFAGLGSVRILDIPAADTAALYFNVRAPELADVSVRRRIAGALHRQAIARLACGDPTCASPDVQASTSVALPRRLTMMVADDDTALRTAAKILRHQLWSLDLEVEIRPLPVPRIVDRLANGEFDLALLPLTLANHRFGFFLSPGHPKAFPMTGFANPEYDAAVDRADLAAAQEILDRELPVTRLFEIRVFAAVDSAFCGDVIPTSSSWLWLSKLYPCEGPPP